VPAQAGTRRQTGITYEKAKMTGETGMILFVPFY